MSRGQRLQPRGARRRIQAVWVPGTPPGNLSPVVAFVFPEGGAVPPHLLQVSSATYSLGSPPIAGVQRVAVMNFSLSSPAIPRNVPWLALMPDV